MITSATAKPERQVVSQLGWMPVLSGREEHSSERRSLEDVTKPICSTSNRAAPAAGDPTPITT